MNKFLLLFALLVFSLSVDSYALVGVGVRGGVIRTEYYGISPLYGAHMDFTVLKIFGLEISGAYWKKTVTHSWGDPASQIWTENRTNREISVEATGKFKIPFPGVPLSLYVGIGPGSYFRKVKQEAPPPAPPSANYEESYQAGGIHAVTGVSVKPLGSPLSFGVQGKYALTHYREAWGNQASVVGLLTYHF